MSNERKRAAFFEERGLRENPDSGIPIAILRRERGGIFIEEVADRFTGDPVRLIYGDWSAAKLKQYKATLPAELRDRSQFTLLKIGSLDVLEIRDRARGAS